MYHNTTYMYYNTNGHCAEVVHVHVSRLTFFKPLSQLLDLFLKLSQHGIFRIFVNAGVVFDVLSVICISNREVDMSGVEFCTLGFGLTLSLHTYYMGLTRVLRIILYMFINMYMYLSVLSVSSQL